jgi:hypothetical protein
MSRGGTDDAEVARPQSIAGIIQSAVKATSVLAACGYISLRAHFNRLGLSMGGADTERYVQETWRFVYVMVQEYALPIGALVLLWAGWRAWAERRVAAHRAKAGRPPRVAEPLSLMAAALLAYVVYRLGVASVYGADIAVGRELDSGVLRGAHASFRVMNLLVYPCVAAFACMSVWRDGGHVAGVLAWSRLAARWMWWVVALHIPITFGLTVHGASYPRCRVVTKASEGHEAQAGHPAPAKGEGEPQPAAPSGPMAEKDVGTTARDDSFCGLLIAQTKESVTVWRARRGHAETVIMPANDVEILVYEIRDLLSEAANATENHDQDFPNCP